MKFTDFKGFFNVSYAKVISVDNPHDDYYVIELQAEEGFSWQAGEHASFSLPDRNVEGKKWRAFSIASTEAEGKITIATRTGKDISSFKKELIAMKAGERVRIRGAFGWFKVMDNTSPIVMVASGVGITPIRALMAHLAHDLSRDIHAVYASKGYHLFGDALSVIADNNERMTLMKTASREETTHAYVELAKKYGNQAFYYVSGSMQVIKASKENLIKEGIKKNRIISDPFLGY